MPRLHFMSWLATVKRDTGSSRRIYSTLTQLPCRPLVMTSSGALRGACNSSDGNSSSGNSSSGNSSVSSSSGRDLSISNSSGRNSSNSNSSGRNVSGSLAAGRSPLLEACASNAAGAAASACSGERLDKERAERAAGVEAVFHPMVMSSNGTLRGAHGVS